jgi:hypothetical protein
MIRKIKKEKETIKMEVEEDIEPASCIPIPPDFDFKLEISARPYRQLKREKMEDWMEFLGVENIKDLSNEERQIFKESFNCVN